jgi:Spy/CpxP family protein refolding chaperone
LIERAKKLLADNKPADALRELQQLAAQKLTPEQQAKVKELMQQAQQSASKAADKAADAVNNLLNKK